MDALLSRLSALPRPTSHLQHLAIRLRRAARAYQDVHQSAPSRDEHKARLMSRLEEVEEQLEELALLAGAVQDGRKGGEGPEEVLTGLGLGGGEGGGAGIAAAKGLLSVDGLEDTGVYSECAMMAKQLRLKLATTPPTPTKPSPLASASTSHSRSPSTSTLPRKPPPPSAPSLATFLACASPAPPPLPAPLSTSQTLQSRAQDLSSAFTLHLLANEPASVLHPGQSLASLFRQQLAVAPPNAPRPADGNDAQAPRGDTLEEQVRASVGGAVVDELLGRLGEPAGDAESAAEPWRELRRHLWEVAGPLIPGRMGGGRTKADLQAKFRSEHAIPSDVAEATVLVWTLASTLAQLCAPSRDSQARAVLSALSQDDSAASPAASPSLAQFASATRLLLSLAEDMARDVAAFRSNLASAVATDGELEALATHEAAGRERAVVLAQYAGDVVGEGVEAQRRVVDARVGEWVNRKTGTDVSGWEKGSAGWKAERVAEALVETVFGEAPVALPEEPATGSPQDPASNVLPPTLVIPSPRLFSLQNKLQAVLILACLVSLAGPPAHAPSSGGAPKPAWVPRVWTLLTAAAAQAPASTASADDPPTRLAHLADELLSATYEAGAAVTLAVEAERARVRAGVDRILRYEDPVFRLLRGRLKEGLNGALRTAVRASGEVAEAAVGVELPTLRAGRVVGTGGLRTPGAGVGAVAVAKASTRAVAVGSIRGFASPALLREKVEECAVELGRIEAWQRGVWGAGEQGDA